MLPEPMDPKDGPPTFTEDLVWALQSGQVQNMLKELVKQALREWSEEQRK